MTTNTAGLSVPDLSELDDDGATVELADGRTLRLRIEPDEIDVMDLWSDEWYGRVTWVDDRACYDDYRWRANRPDGFTGNAEKIHYDYRSDDAAWWEPPADGPKRGTPEFTVLRRNVHDLLEYGFTRVGLELLDGTDAYGRPNVVDAAWVGGIEPFADAGYLADVAADLYAELGL